MPLVKGRSDKAFEHNIKAEIGAGKPQKQALAIAYATKRKAQQHAHGGHVEMCAHGGPMHCMDGCYADGGPVAQDGDKQTLGSIIGYPGSPKPKPTQQSQNDGRRWNDEI
jgi:hypothetical protein